MKVIINKLYVNYKKKDGTPYKNARVSIYGKDENGKDVKNATGFVPKNSEIISKKTGDVVDVELEQDGQYLNFTVIGGSEDDTEDDLGEKSTHKKQDVTFEAIYDRLKKLEDAMFEVQGQLAIQDTKKKASDLPF